jgi:cell division protein FtsB
MLAWLGRLAQGLIAPVLLFGLAGFFIWHAQLGDERHLNLTRDLVAANAQFDLARTEREVLERRVNSIRGDEMDRDQVDERARTLLNLSRPNEIIIPYAQGDRLY